MTSTDFDIFGRITKRYVTLDADGTADPLVTRYDVAQAPRTRPQISLKLPNHLPIRRISKGARIIPAEEGDPCIISRRGSLFVVWAFTEGIPFTEGCP